MLKFLTATVIAALIAGPALAADLSTKDSRTTAATAAHVWAGPYIGAHIGYGWIESDHHQTNGGMPSTVYGADGKGVLGGATVGYNWQFNQIVMGIEAEGGFMDVTGKGRIPSSTPPHYQAIDVDTGFYGLAAGRVGFAWDRTLFYGKGGWAFLEGDVGQTTTKPGFVTNRSGNLQGFVYGLGAEQALNEHVSLKLEWLHFTLDPVTGAQTSITDSPVGFVYTNHTEADIDTIKLGVSYKFGR
jgi:outer membrane immunogenic protein